MNKLNYMVIPNHCRTGLKNYIERGVPTGDFLRCVLENDLVHSFAKADHINRPALFQYAQFLYHAPMDCWGNKEKVDAWIKHQGLMNKEREGRGATP